MPEILPLKRAFKDVVWLDPAKLKPYNRNIKNHPHGQLAKLEKIILEDGFDVPIVVDENYEILKGHARQKVAINAGIDEVPVIVRSGLTTVQKKRLRISDNRIAELAEWNEAFLKDELKELSELGIDLELTGFEQDEIDALLAQADAPPDFEEVDENIKTEHQCPKCGYWFSGGKTRKVDEDGKEITDDSDDEETED
jgi:ParB-like chromosome segregation protein Spo0J